MKGPWEGQGQLPLLEFVRKSDSMRDREEMRVKERERNAKSKSRRGTKSVHDLRCSSVQLNAQTHKYKYTWWE